MSVDNWKNISIYKSIQKIKIVHFLPSVFSVEEIVHHERQIVIIAVVPVFKNCLFSHFFIFNILYLSKTSDRAQMWLHNHFRALFFLIGHGRQGLFFFQWKFFFILSFDQIIVGSDLIIKGHLHYFKKRGCSNTSFLRGSFVL
jgi:hypothetical protein